MHARIEVISTGGVGSTDSRLWGRTNPTPGNLVLRCDAPRCGPAPLGWIAGRAAGWDVAVDGDGILLTCRITFFVLV